MNDEERRLGKAQSSRDWHRVTRHEAWFKKHESPTRESSKAPPTLDELREAFLHRNDSCENMIRLGSMLEDIEAKYHVGYEFYSDHFEHETFYEVEYDAPWLTGIRGYIKTDPFLLSKYKTLMRYKKLAADFRKAIGLDDPNPASLVFEATDEDWLLPIQAKARALLTSCKKSFRALARKIAEVRC
jgi:hypothetical protein